MREVLSLSDELNSLLAPCWTSAGVANLAPSAASMYVALADGAALSAAVDADQLLLLLRRREQLLVDAPCS